MFTNDSSPPNSNPLFKPLRHLSPRLAIGGLCFLWLGIHLYLWQRFGFFFHDDTPRYYDYAQGIINEGTFPFTHNFWYLGYALFLCPFLYFDLPLGAIIFAQVCLSGLAAFAIGKISYQLSGRIGLGIIASGLFIIWFRVQWFNYYILTESLFVHLNVLFFYLVLQLKKIDFRSLLVLPLLLFICLIRPNGFFTLLTFLFYISALIYQQYPKIFWKSLPFIGILTAIAFVWLNHMLSNFYIIRAFERGEIICGYLENNLFSSNPLQLPQKEHSPLYQLGYFIICNFAYFAELAFWRLMYFFGNIRSAYSIFHNAFIILVLYPCYYFALIAIFRTKLFFPAKVYMVIFIALYGVLALFTGANWNGRFIAPIIPFVFILAGIGIGQFQKMYFPNFNHYFPLFDVPKNSDEISLH